MGFTRDLIAGFAQLLEDAGVATFRETGAYEIGDLNPIMRGSVPGTPDRIIVLTAYTVGDDPTLSDGEAGIQVRTRGTTDVTVVDDLDDDVFDVVQGYAGELSTGVKVQLARRRSGAYLGVDKNGRHERTSNYYLHVHRPSAHRT